MTPPELLSTAWATAVLRAAQEDEVFVQSARALTGTMELYDESSRVTIRFERGAAAAVTAVGGTDADIRLGGSRAGWTSALTAARDLGAATDPAHGGLAIDGDFRRLAGVAIALMRLWMAMRRVSNGITDRLLEPRPKTALAGDASRPTEPEVTGHYVDVLGYRTYYESVGEGPAVVCIHSGGADGREYRHLLPRLAQLGYRAIALDMPGHGKSYPDLGTLCIPETADAWISFVLAFAARLGLERPAYVGCAMSASVLLRLAAEHPDATSAIVAVGATANFTGWLSDEYLDALNHPQINVGDFMESTTPGLIGPARPVEAQNEARWHNARNLTSEVMQADLRIYAEHDVRALLPRITAPVLHLIGEFDRTVSDENASSIAAGIPSVRTTRLQGVGHFPMIEDPDLYNDAVTRFLSHVVATGDAASADR